MREDKKMPEHDAGFDAETAAAEADRARKASQECAEWHAPDGAPPGWKAIDWDLHQKKAATDLGERQRVPAPMPGDLRQGARAKEVYNGTAWVPLDKLEHVNVQTWEGVTPATRRAALVGEPPIGEGPGEEPLDERTKKWHLMWDTVKGIETMFKHLQEQLDELADSDKTDG